jgi:hypothetical protein
MDDNEDNDGCGGLLAGIWAFAGILMMIIVVAVVASVVLFAIAQAPAI